MAKGRTVYRCSACGAASVKWAGQCPECGAWNTLEESLEREDSSAKRRRGKSGSPPAVRQLSEVEGSEAPRQTTGIAEMDRVLGGGLVPGATVLIGGDPGIGKSTLLLQVLVRLADSLNVLYVAGEESLEQVGLRASRLGLGETPLALLAETGVEPVLEALDRERPRALVVDSIQTLHTETLQSAPGNVAQLRESAAKLIRYAKDTGIALLLVGHVTKEGHLAGPRILEHMVDTVLYFEADVGARFRVIRAVKNRFGAVNELGVFAMTDQGLREVSNPSAIFLSRHDAAVSGSVLTCIREGSRPLLLEVQALADDSPLSQPRRVTVGLDGNRLAMLLAVLHRHGGISMFGQDVYVNVVGGVRVTETAADLAILLAVLSSFRDRAVPADTLIFGEVGLAGEIRPVPGGEERLQESAKHGFRRAIVPRANAPRKGRLSAISIEPVSHVREAIDAL